MINTDGVCAAEHTNIILVVPLLPIMATYSRASLPGAQQQQQQQRRQELLEQQARIENELATLSSSQYGHGSIIQQQQFTVGFTWP